MTLSVNNVKLQYFIFDGTLQSLKDHLRDCDFYDFNIKRQTAVISNSGGDWLCRKDDYVIETQDNHWEPFHPKVVYEVFRKINEEEK